MSTTQDTHAQTKAWSQTDLNKLFYKFASDLYLLRGFSMNETENASLENLYGTLWGEGEG